MRLLVWAFIQYDAVLMIYNLFYLKWLGHRCKEIMGRHREKTAIYNPRKELSLRRNEPCWHLELGLLAARTMRKYVICCFRPRSVEPCYGRPSKPVRQWLYISSPVQIWSTGQSQHTHHTFMQLFNIYPCSYSLELQNSHASREVFHLITKT